MGGKSSTQKNRKEAETKTTSLDQFGEGAVVYLNSKASGKLLRIHEDNVDALGEEGTDSQFTVHKKDSKSALVVTLQNVANAEKYVQISEGQVGPDGTGDELSELKVVETEEGCVAFESAKTAGQFIAVQEDGSVQTVTELGPSTHFTPVKVEETATATEATPTEVEEKKEVEEEVVEDKEEQAATES